MRIAVLGVGNFGRFFARRLARQKVEILAIDGDKEAIDEIAGDVSNAVVGDCTNRELLAELDVGSFEYAVISLGSRMDASVLAFLGLECNCLQ